MKYADPPVPSLSDAPTPSALERARWTVERLRKLEFRAYLSGHALSIADVTGRGRDVTRYLPIGEVFDAIVAGLNEDPRLLNSMQEDTR